MNQAFNEFVSAFEAHHKARPDLRRGQAAYETLWKWDLRLASKVDGSEIDPYYVDERIPDFLEWVAAHLKVAS